MKYFLSRVLLAVLLIFGAVVSAQTTSKTKTHIKNSPTVSFSVLGNDFTVNQEYFWFKDGQQGDSTLLGFRYSDGTGVNTKNLNQIKEGRDIVTILISRNLNYEKIKKISKKYPYNEIRSEAGEYGNTVMTCDASPNERNCSINVLLKNNLVVKISYFSLFGDKDKRIIVEAAKKILTNKGG